MLCRPSRAAKVTGSRKFVARERYEFKREVQSAVHSLSSLQCSVLHFEGGGNETQIKTLTLAASAVTF